ncbi:MAG: OmpA family protein, partial [bacterium]|nr:OmpA family protein [bacterium]
MIKREIEIDNRGWEVTFSDMLTLLLTFFVFIISVSTFEAIKYKKFWKKTDAPEPEIKAASASFKFELIRGLKVPVLNNEADQLLTEIESTFVNNDFQGVDVFYDENKISLMVSEQLSFEGSRYQLKEEVKPLLLKLVEPINKSKFDVNIEGHTDGLISPKIDNMELSLDRALSVARFLIAGGVEKQKVSVSGYGPHR